MGFSKPGRRVISRTAVFTHPHTRTGLPTVRATNEEEVCRLRLRVCRAARAHIRREGNRNGSTRRLPGCLEDPGENVAAGVRAQADGHGKRARVSVKQHGRLWHEMI